MKARNMMKKQAYYHLPGLFEFYELYRIFLPLFREHREYFYDWCEIGSIYGAPSDLSLIHIQMCIRDRLKSTLSKEARTKSRGEGDVSPFSALTTALAATIGTGNIVGVATAMVSGGPGALVWMWISAAFGLTSKFSECMLAIKYREVNAKGEMSGCLLYTSRCV